LQTTKGGFIVIRGSSVASGALRRLAALVLAVLSLAILGFVAPALAAEEVEQEPAQVGSETEADDEGLEEGSAWYPPAGAQGSGQGGTGPVVIQDPGTVTDPEAAAEEGRKVPSAEWVIAPIPFSNPTIGTGLVLAPSYIFPIDETDALSPPSIIAVAGMYSNNGSKAFAAGGNAYYDEDRHRVSGGIGYYDFKYDFFGIGNEAGDRELSIPLRQRGAGIQLEYLRLWRDDTYFGGRHTFTEARVSFDVELPDWWPDIVPTEYRSTTGAIGLLAERDTRNSTFYPTKGILLETGVDFYAPTWGSDFTYQVYEVGYNSYRSLNEQAVLASRAYARQVGGDVPFYGLSLFGRQGDLRGYTAGQYRDKFMLALQAEYRQRLKGRWGYVVFLGVGEVAPRVAELNFQDLLPSGGVGLRYTLAEENQVNMRMDFAYGKSGGAIHFGAGEAF
jgi:hypothetical protein